MRTGKTEWNKRHYAQRRSNVLALAVQNVQVHKVHRYRIGKRGVQSGCPKCADVVSKMAVKLKDVMLNDTPKYRSGLSKMV